MLLPGFAPGELLLLRQAAFLVCPEELDADGGNCTRGSGMGPRRAAHCATSAQLRRVPIHAVGVAPTGPLKALVLQTTPGPLRDYAWFVYVISSSRGRWELHPRHRG